MDFVEIKSKACKDCGLTKPLSDYYRHPRRLDGAIARCKPCHNQLMKNWYVKNKERHNEINRQNYKKNPVKILAKTRLYQRHRRKAAVKWADKVAVQQYYILARYLSRETGIKWHVDHIIPLNHDKVCGLHTEHNLTFLPSSINLSKANKWTS